MIPAVPVIRPLRAGLLLAAVTTLAVAGCATTTPPRADSAASTAITTTEMHRCSESPIEWEWADDPFAPREPLTLTYDAEARRFLGDPAPLPDDLVALADGAVVQVQSPYGSGMGSGFVVDIGDRTVVLTAAHVTGTSPYEDLRLVDLAGQSAGVLEGCAAYQAQDMLIELDRTDAGAAIDVAVLIPDGPIGTTALTIGTRPEAGSWVFFDNFEGQFRPDYGRDLFTAVILGPIWDVPGSVSALTGIGTLHQPDDRHPPSMPGTSDLVPENAAVPGSSGGAVVDLDGRVVGMSVAAHREVNDADWLEVWDVTVSGVTIGPESAVMPIKSILVPPEGMLAVIQAARENLASLATP